MILRLRSLPRIAVAAIISGAAAVFVILAALLTTNHLLPLDGDWQLALISTRTSQSELCLMDIENAAQRQLTNNIGYVRQPVWSPDGTRIAFVGGFDGGSIFVMNADGTALSNLTAAMNPRLSESPTWSPDGTRIAFNVWDTSGNASDIYVMDVVAAPDGGWTASDIHPLTFLPQWKSQPTWSPDGRYIAYGVSAPTLDIWLIDLASGQNWPLVETPYDDQTPVWSADGRLAYVTWVDTVMGYEIFAADIAPGADGQVRAWNPLRLTNNAAMDWQPAWSPDGSQIAFLSDRAGISFDLYIMNADGTDQRRLTYTDSPESSPQWSPDGSQLAFIMERRYTGRFAATGSCGILAADVRRGLIRQLTNTFDGICDSSPTWRPHSPG